MPIRIKRYKTIEIEDGWQCRNPFCKKVLDSERECADHEREHMVESIEEYERRGDLTDAVNATEALRHHDAQYPPTLVTR